MHPPAKPAAGPRSDVYTVIAVLPFVAVCVIAAFLAAEQARTIALSEALGRARAAMTAIDGELRGHILTVEAFATSRSVEGRDLRSFYEDSRRVLASQPAWLNIGVQSDTGAQLFNAVQAFGSPPPPQVDQDSLERALERGTPQIGNVAVGPAIDRAATRVRVPIRTDGKVRYVITVPLKPQLFEDLLREQRLPGDWEIALLDGKKRLIAAIPASLESEVGDTADARLRNIKRAKEGFVQVARPDGSEVYTSFVTSAMSGWVINVSIPKDTIETAAWNGSLPIVVGLLAALVIAAFMVWLGSRR
jgi:hypothetical protein